MKFKTISILMVLVGISQGIFAQDLLGKWKTIDDKSGFSRGDIQITQDKNGLYSGKIIRVYSIPGTSTNEGCKDCIGSLRNKSLIGLEILNSFSQNPNNSNEYLGGKVFDPQTGKIYNAKIKLIANGKKLILRGYVGTSLIGRSSTWIRIE